MFKEPTIRSKSCVRQEHKPQNDEQMKNTWSYHSNMQATLYEVDK
jgi:hypothetical protein